MDVKLAAAVADPELNVRDFCRRHGIGKSAFYKWRARFRADGVDGMKERSRRPLSLSGLLPGSVEDAIVRARKELLAESWDAGPDSILFRLEGNGVVPVPSRATIWRVLRRRGLITAQPQKRPTASYRRFEYSRPNECWQIDATHWTLTNGTVIEIINIIDDHSRVLIASYAVPVTTSAAAWATFVAGATQWGLPGRVLSDNGLAFSAQRRRGRTVPFSANLRQLGITPITSTPYHPQTCGKVERFHQTLKRWLDGHPAASVPELQQLLDQFAQHYNHHRPHRACGRQPPITRFIATAPAGPAERPITTPSTVHTLIVEANGRIDVNGYTISLGNRWARHTVTAITQHHDIAVFAGHTLVRAITVDPTKRTQPLYQRTGRPPTTVRDDPRQNRPR